MPEGNYQLQATGRNNLPLSFDAFRDGNDSEGNPLVRLITKQESAFSTLISDIRTELLTGAIDVNIISGGSDVSVAFDSNAVTVAVATTTVIDIDCRGKNTLGCVIANTGATALNNFQVQVRYHINHGSYNPISFSNADFDTNVGRQSGNALIPIQASSGIGNPSTSPNPRLLAGGANGWLEMRVSAYESVRLVASVAAGTTSLRIRGNMQ